MIAFSQWSLAALVLAPILLIRPTQVPIQPKTLSACDLASAPKSFDKKQVRVRATLTVEFENFSLVTGKCRSSLGIWVTFGGDVPGIVSSMWNDVYRTPGVDVTVDGVAYGINKDNNFRQLYALLAALDGDRPAYRVTASLTGTFLAGNAEELPGYGHMGCCSLLVVTAASDVASNPRANLTVRGTVLKPDGTPAQGFAVFSDVLGGSPPLRQETVTNERGQFEFSNSGQLLRFEHPNYRPVALPVRTGGAPVRVQLEDAARSDWVVRPCQASETFRRVGFSILLALPPTMESEAFEGRSYFLFPRGADLTTAPLFLVHRQPSHAASRNSDVRLSPSRQRWIKDGTGTVIGIDARGIRRNGEHWRSVLFWADDATLYSAPKGVSTAEMDAVLDSACSRKAPS